KAVLNGLPHEPVLSHVLATTPDDIQLTFWSRSADRALYSATVSIDYRDYFSTIDFKPRDLYDSAKPKLIHKLAAAVIRANQYLTRVTAPQTAVAAAAVEHQPESKPDHGLNRVAGMHELKETLREDVIWPLRNPEQ